MNYECSIAAPGAQEPLAPYLSYWSIVTRSLGWHDPNSTIGFLLNAIKMQRQSEFARPRLRRYRSHRGELPGSGVTSSTAHRAGPSAQDPAGTFLRNRPLPTGTVLASDMVYPICSIKLGSSPGRESYRGIVLDPAESELADAPV